MNYSLKLIRVIIRFNFELNFNNIKSVTLVLKPYKRKEFINFCEYDIKMIFKL